MRDSLLPPESEPDPDRPTGHLTPMPPGPLAVVGSVGLVAGWAVHPVGERLLDSSPDVGWIQVGVLWFLAAALAVTAWQTGRDPRRLRAHQAVNRLVMARACALVGALLAGGYVGFAIGWLGTGAPDLVVERVVRAGLAAVAGGVILAASLWLERACRTQTPPDSV